MQDNYYAVIMAGGVGSRFWPISTQENPKQFHDMLGAGQSLIQKTFQRLKQFIPAENVLVLTNARYKDLVKEQIPEMEVENIVTEPAMRNTAPCILYAAKKIQKKNKDAVMIVAPSDHWIEDEAAFAADVKHCFERASKEAALFTLGIKPSFPNTGFGYIEYDKSSKEALKSVAQFREKPDYETAKEFLAQGNFLWNAGIFMWSVQSILDAFAASQPDMFALFCEGDTVYNTEAEAKFIEENYPKAEDVSIDYAILEKAKTIYVLPASFDWNDLGTWGSLYEKLDKSESNNAVVNARLLAKDATHNMIRTEDNKIVVLDGINDYIVVDKKDVLLIYPKSKEQDIKQVLNEVRGAFGDEYA
ncbi:MAG: mannose-1-phosphate guanylyltransferase [Flavobacteriaceae bacterium]|nr:mannose-1-phosphate guanylyltransferase [Flavobacteriaceae bacterium]